MADGSQATADSPLTPPVQNTGGAGNAARLNGRYDILLDQPLDFMSTTGADAYMAVDLLDRGNAVYGLVHKPDVPYRGDVAKSLLDAPISNLVNPVDQGVVGFDLGGGLIRRLMTVMQYPRGGPLFQNGEPKASFSSNSARFAVLESTVRALLALSGRGIPHRAIRPDNMYFADDSQEEIILGECISVPPGADQPNAFEPLERAFADPEGRGDADSEADMYALGATMMSLYTGQIAGEGRDESQLRHARINQGSFWALSGSRQIPGNVNSLLRGLLSDDSNERWTLQDLIHWMDGGLPPRRLGMSDYALSRPVSFMGVTYSDRRLLAEAFSSNPKQAADFLRRSEFSNWIQKVISRDAYSERIEDLLNVTSKADLSAKRGADEAMVARVCTHLDPTGPIRFRSLCVQLDGLGPALAQAFRTNDQDRLNAFRELLGTDLMTSILRIAAERNPQVAQVENEIRGITNLLDSERPGFGLERVLYKLNRDLPCNSKKLEREWADSIANLLRSLDRQAEATGGLQGLMDQHIFAFCGAHQSGLSGDFGRISHARKTDQYLAPTLAEFYSRLQQASGVERLQRLVATLVHNYRPMIKSLRSRTRKKRTEKRLEELSNEGSIIQLVRNLDLKRIAQLDQQEFARAKRQLTMLNAERKKLARKITPAMAKPRNYGYRVAMALGYLVMLLTIVIFSMIGV